MGDYLRFFDVGHGSCALLVSSDGATVMFDCGGDASLATRPTDWLADRGVAGFDALVVSHFDEDHVSGIPYLRSRLRVSGFGANRSAPLGIIALQKFQTGGVTPAISAALAAVSEFSGAPVVLRPGIAMRTFRVPYPDATDQNNLSLVTFAGVGAIHAIFPGDLEGKGWRYLLSDGNSVARLTRCGYANTLGLWRGRDVY